MLLARTLDLSAADFSSDTALSQSFATPRPYKYASACFIGSTGVAGLGFGAGFATGLTGSVRTGSGRVEGESSADSSLDSVVSEGVDSGVLAGLAAASAGCDSLLGAATAGVFTGGVGVVCGVASGFSGEGWVLAGSACSLATGLFDTSAT